MFAGSDRKLLLCLTQLKWDLVVQRPHHLMRRAAQDWRVVVLEEPRFEPPSAGLPTLQRSVTADGLELVIPMLPYWDGVPGSVERLLQPLLERLFAELGPPDVAWYSTPN